MSHLFSQSTTILRYCSLISCLMTEIFCVVRHRVCGITSILAQYLLSTRHNPSGYTSMQQEGRALAPQTGGLLCLVPPLLLTICRRVNVRHGCDILDKSIGLVLVGDTASCAAVVPPATLFLVYRTHRIRQGITHVRDDDPHPGRPPLRIPPRLQHTTDRPQRAQMQSRRKYDQTHHEFDPSRTRNTAANPWPALRARLVVTHGSRVHTVHAVHVHCRRRSSGSGCLRGRMAMGTSQTHKPFDMFVFLCICTMFKQWSSQLQN
ncbi:hypothetical protein DFH07DRAFT_943485 [Mycena maculata]|uniref:Uncharacterized protein n=1 Tax=Mycena maculata TaxID=230809 RepID=A0AAD7IGL2_9AGAR|nr:hypothetical protein DFH07DRAFT_943485 [Mycena maculata]